MTSSPPIQPDLPLSPDWEELDRLLADLRRLAQQAVTVDSFYQGLLSLAVERLPVEAGIVWESPAEGRVEAICQIRPDVVGMPQNQLSLAFHWAIVRRVLEGREPCRFAPHSTESGYANPTDRWLLFQPVLEKHKVIRVVELAAAGGLPAEALQGLLRILEALAELAEDYERHEQSRRERDLHQQTLSLHRFSLRIHQRLGLPGLAAEIVNEARRLMDVDRVSLVASRGRRMPVIGVSGLTTWDRRSPSIARLEELARVVSRVGPIEYPAAGEHPPEVEAAIQAFVDETHARQLVALPLRVACDPSDTRHEDMETRLVGVIVAEEFHESMPSGSVRWLHAAVPSISIAMDNGLLCDRWWRFRWLSRIGSEDRFRARGRSRVGGVLAIALLLITFLAWPVPLIVSAPGELLPQRRFDAYAPAEGIVVRIAVESGQVVAEGDELVELRSPAIEGRLTEVLGRLRATAEALAAARTLRLSSPQERTDHSTPRLGAEEEELKASLAGLQQQYELLQGERSRLVIRSPMPGEVITRDLTQRLQARPVAAGNVLLRVADTHGPWELKLELPESHVPEILALRNSGSAAPLVEFVVAAAPQVTHLATVTEWGAATQLDADGRPVLPVVASIQRPPPGVAPGATVRARVICRTRPRAFVWFHGGWEAFRTWWFTVPFP